MKNKVRPLFYILLLFGFIISNEYQVSGQEKVNISIGIGLPELMNIGACFQFNQVQIGLSVGSMPLGSSEKIISISGDFYYHFGGSSELSNRHPWYGRIGLDYLRDETKSFIDKYLFLNTRIGRDFNISKKFGIAIDVGAVFQLSNDVIRKTPSHGMNLGIEYPVLPSLGIGLFYRI